MDNFTDHMAQSKVLCDVTRRFTVHSAMTGRV